MMSDILVTIGLDNSMTPISREAIAQTNADLLKTETPRANFT